MAIIASDGMQGKNKYLYTCGRSKHDMIILKRIMRSYFTSYSEIGNISDIMVTVPWILILVKEYWRCTTNATSAYHNRHSTVFSSCIWLNSNVQLYTPPESKRGHFHTKSCYCTDNQRKKAFNSKNPAKESHTSAIIQRSCKGDAYYFLS